MLWDVGDRLNIPSLVDFPDTQYDAFGRLRVSQQDTRFDSQLQYDLQPLIWNQKIVGAGSCVHLPDESAAGLAVGTASGDSVIRQTKEYFRYQPGKSQQIFCTGVFGSAQANTNKLIGYGDAKNGIFFGRDGDGTYVLLRSSVTGTVSDARKVYQEDWNLDTMDGLGPSRVTSDWSKSQIFTIDLEWLGVGRVRLGLVYSGKIVTVHTFDNSNDQTTTYMTTANLPVRYEITNTDTTAGAATLKQICTQVSSEGGSSRLQYYPFSAISTNFSVPNGYANRAIIYCIRHSLTFNSITNRALFRPEDLAAVSYGGTSYINVLYNPTISGGTFSQHSAESIVDSATDVGTSFSGGISIGELIIGTSPTRKSASSSEPRGLSSRLPFGLDIDGANPIALAFEVYTTSQNVTMDFRFGWEEIR